MSESLNVLVAIFFFNQDKVNKPKNAMKFSESRKNHIAEYQACKTALESMDQSQVFIRAGSKHSCP